MEYYHETKSLLLKYEGECKVLYEKEIPIGERKLLAVQKKDKEVPFVIVPGYVVRSYNTESGGKVSKVEPISDPKEKETIEQILRKEGFEGHIEFW